VTYLELAAGFIYLLMGGDLLVRGAVALARQFRVPPVVVAATVVGFGTSLPELVVSVHATLLGYPDLILGNVVGSNIANVLLVGGASAIVYPIAHDDPAVRRNAGLMIAAVGGFAVLAYVGDLSRAVGIGLLVAFGVMMVATVRSTVAEMKGGDTSTPLDWLLGIPSRLGTITLFIVAGVVMLPLGAQLLVDSAVTVAQRFDVPEAVIGLTVLAIGTSLPELTTTVLAAMEKRSDVAIGAIVGSNTFNVLAIMGVSATLSSTPIPVSARFLTMDVPVMLVTSGVLTLFAWRVRPIGRAGGIVMLLAYVAYLGTLYLVI
jgi:cation:H+ antiporter